MKLSRVTAHAFGPFHGETLELAPGLTVVWGVNEAGKSTWHSAVRLTITGLRRSRGRATKEDQAVIDRRRPWTGDTWRLEGQLNLDDGDELIVTWDLNSRVATVHDGLGRERSNVWMTDGACDLSRIVGLDRSSFLATACVRQSDLRGVRDEPSRLQDLLQTAAASAAADGTASAAINRLSSYYQEHVGLNRTNSTKPLAMAVRRLDQTRQALDEAQSAHQERLALLADLAQKRHELTALNKRLEALKVAERLTVVKESDESRAKAAADLEAVETDLKALKAAADHQRTALEVLGAARRVAETRAVLDRAKAHHVNLRVLQDETASKGDQLDDYDREELALLAAKRCLGISSELDDLRGKVEHTEAASGEARAAIERKASIERQIAQLELEVADRTARRSSNRFRRAAELHAKHTTAPPTLAVDEELARRAHTVLDRWNDRPSPPQLDGPTAAEIHEQLQSLPDQPSGDLAPADAVLAAEREWRIATDLQLHHETQRPAEADPPPADVTPGELRQRADVLSSPSEDPLAIEAELAHASTTNAGPLRRLIPVAAGAAVLGLILGFVVHPALFILCLAGIGAAVVGLARRSAVDPSVAASLDARLAHARAAAQQKDAVRAELAQQGLPTDPDQLRAVASALESSYQSQLALERWVEGREEHRLRADAAAAELVRELELRGVTGLEPAVALSTYRAQCAGRAEQAAVAGSRAALTARLDHRQQLEAQAASVLATHKRLDDEVVALGADLGVPPGRSVNATVTDLQNWLSTRTQRRAQLLKATEEWADLQRLLAGQTLAELEAIATADDNARLQCAAKVTLPDDQQSLGDLPDRDLEEASRRLRAEHVRAAEDASRQPVQDLAALHAQVDGLETEYQKASQALQESAGEQAESYQSLSVAEVEAKLDSCRRDRASLRKQRDETAGRVRQLTTEAPDIEQCEQDLVEREHELGDLVERHPEAASEVALDASASELGLALKEREEALDAADGRVQERLGTLKAKEEAFATMRSTADQVRDLTAELAEKSLNAGLALDPEALPGLVTVSRQRTDAETRRSELAEAIAGLDGQVKAREANAVDPAAAEEAHESAKQELQRVQALGEVLETTRTLLEAAQDRVHRDIAPRLNEATNRWLPTMFGERYSTVRIDPATLEVQVFSEGDPRRADLLSQGTSEQFYLLLRIALVETLTASSGESCPLILDDITVNFDSERKVAALELLKELASERQVVLFTQEEEVRAWADTSLGDNDRLVRLPGRVPVGPLHASPGR